MAKKISELTKTDKILSDSSLQSILMNLSTTSAGGYVPFVDGGQGQFATTDLETKTFLLKDLLSVIYNEIIQITPTPSSSSDISVFNYPNLSTNTVYTANSDYIMINALDEYTPGAKQSGITTDISIPYDSNKDVIIDLGDLTSKTKYIDCGNIGCYAQRITINITFIYKYNGVWYINNYYSLNPMSKISLKVVSGKIWACTERPKVYMSTETGFWQTVDYQAYTEDGQWNTKYSEATWIDTSKKSIIDAYIATNP